MFLPGAILGLCSFSCTYPDSAWLPALWRRRGRMTRIASQPASSLLLHVHRVLWLFTLIDWQNINTSLWCLFIPWSVWQNWFIWNANYNLYWKMIAFQIEAVKIVLYWKLNGFTLYLFDFTHIWAHCMLVMCSCVVNGLTCAHILILVSKVCICDMCCMSFKNSSITKHLLFSCGF